MKRRPYRSATLRQVEARRRAEQLLVAVAVPRDRQEVEDPAAAVVHHDDRGLARPGGSSPAARSCRGRGRRRRSPRTSARWRPRPRPSPEDTRPSMPLAPRLARKRSGRAVAGRKVSRSRIGMLDATYTVLSAGSSAHRSRCTRGSNSSSPSSVRKASTSLSAAAAASQPPLQPAAVLAHLELLGERPEERLGIDPRDQLRRPRRLVPPAVGVDHHLPDLRPLQPRAHRLRRDHVADAHHQVRGQRLGQVAEQQVVGGDHLVQVVRPAAQLGGRLGQDRVAAGARQRRRRLAQARRPWCAPRGSPRAGTPSAAGRTPRPSRAPARAAAPTPRSAAGRRGPRARAGWWRSRRRRRDRGRAAR